MPACQNCGAHVTRDYVRVVFPDGVDDPPACYRCPDLTREGNEFRPKLYTDSDVRVSIVSGRESQ